MRVLYPYAQTVAMHVLYEPPALARHDQGVGQAPGQLADPAELRRSHQKVGTTAVLCPREREYLPLINYSIINVLFFVDSK